MASSSPQPTKEHKLPSLRVNLQFLRSSPSSEGVPSWTIYDPVQNKYFHIDWTVYQLLQRWRCGTIEKLIEEISRETTSRLTQADVEDLVKYLYANNLTEQSASGQSVDYVQQEAARHQMWWQWLLHHYLFVKITLVHPDQFLKATLPMVSPLFTSMAGWIVGCMGCLGMVLVIREWDTFCSTFLYFFNWTGVMAYGVALCVVKLIHELGHAYTAARFGCRVPTMGIAFMILMPVLYSDVSDSYRLNSKRKRLWIAAAGVLAELGLAAVASLFWVFLPDGLFRSTAFIIATTSWIMSLLINLNPLMRFDGYYLLVDSLSIPNLQDRSFAFGRWWLRELLFAPRESQPEAVDPSTRRLMILYAWAVWIYRMIVFTGIAVMVYQYFFKVLGIILFAVELVVFIWLPIWREMIVWWERRKTFIPTLRFALTMVGLTIVVSLVLIPWTGRVSVPGLLQPKLYATLYAPLPGSITGLSMSFGQHVRQGDVLVVLENPEFAKQAKMLQTQVALLDLRVQRQAGNAEDRAQRLMLAQAFTAKLTELNGLMEKQKTLALQATIDGIVTDSADALAPGRWINEKLPLAYIVNPHKAIIVGLVPVEDKNVLGLGCEAVFIPNDITRPTLHARITEIREFDEEDISIPYLASIYGGTIPVRRDSQGHLRAEQSVYRVELEVVDQPSSLDQAIVGQLFIDSGAWSSRWRVWDRIGAILIRESGF
ncbi:MAG: efflux RND transporter periplasmic adaptor subunit [Nitrospira sp.]